MSPLGIGNTGVVHQDGDGAEGCLCGLHGSNNAGGIRHVEAHRKGLAAALVNLVGQVFEPILASTSDRHTGTTGGQYLGKPLAQPRCCTRNQGHLASQVSRKLRSDFFRHL